MHRMRLLLESMNQGLIPEISPQGSKSGRLCRPGCPSACIPRSTLLMYEPLFLSTARQGDYVRAGMLYMRCQAIEEKVLGPEHPDLAMTLRSRARLLLESQVRASGRFQELVVGTRWRACCSQIRRGGTGGSGRPSNLVSQVPWDRFKRCFFCSRDRWLPHKPRRLFLGSMKRPSFPWSSLWNLCVAIAGRQWPYTK